MLKDLQNKGIEAWKKGYERFLKIRGSPNEIAFGFGLGLFVGMSPFMGIQMAIAIFLAVLFKCNKISAAIGVWISNPVTAPILYPITYWIGAKAVGIQKAYKLPETMDWAWFVHMIQKTPEIISTLTLGGIISGIPLGIAGYLCAYFALKKYQDRIQQKLAERRAARKEKKKKKGERKRKIRNIIRKR